MATKMLVCPECESAVAPGRFACPSCGTVLAAVASTPRSLGWVDDFTPPLVTPPSPPVMETVAAAIHPDEPTDAPMSRSSIGPAWAHGPLERAPGETDLDLVDEDAPLANGLVSDESEPVIADDEPVAGDAEPGIEGDWIADSQPSAAVHPGADGQADENEPVTEADPGSSEATDAEPFVPHVLMAEATIADAMAAEETVEETSATEITTEPTWPETRSWPPQGAERQPMTPVEAPRPRAGAYLPPSAFLTTVDDLGGHGSANAGDGTPSSPAAASSAPSQGAARTGRQLFRSFPAVDPGGPATIVSVGAGIASLGFLMPWAAVVIGSGRIGGYLDQWGLAGPGHPFLVLVLVGLAALATQVDRLPGWARPGLPAVILASLLVGLAWPYLFGSLQPSVGLYVSLVGTLMLGVGGLLDLWDARHAGVTPAV